MCVCVVNGIMTKLDNPPNKCQLRKTCDDRLQFVLKSKTHAQTSAFALAPVQNVPPSVQTVPRSY